MICILRHSITWSFIKHGMVSEVLEFKHSFKHEKFFSKEKPEKQQVALFLHLLGEALEIYNTFSLSTTRQNLDVLLQKFENCCNPRRNIKFERHKFFASIQEPTESINQYVTELRTKASTCEFGELCKS